MLTGTVVISRIPCFSYAYKHGYWGRARALQLNADGRQNITNNKVVILGSGWAGLGAAHHLCNQGFGVTVLESRNDFGGADNVGKHGFRYPYRNIFSLMDDLGIKPFTNWTTSAHYSVDGLEVKFPTFQDLPQLPTPLGILLHTQFLRLSLADRLTSLPLMAAVIDFDNTDTAWRKYDPMTARELFKQFGCSERLYNDILCSLLQVGLFAPAEQCSASATLSILYYLILAHQKDFDVAWCRGSVREKIFEPWMDSMKSKGCEFLEGRTVTDLVFDEQANCISAVVCGGEIYPADAVILAENISTIKELISNSPALCTRDEFLRVLNLGSIDVLTLKLWLDKKVNIPNAANTCSSSDHSLGCSFFNLNMIHDEHKLDESTVLQADFYHANELLPLKDEVLLSKVMSCLSICVDELTNAAVIKTEIGRCPSALSHFFPGSYKFMIRGSTSVRNLFMAGDWIVNRHGSWSQEKSYVTGLEAANRIVDFLETGRFAKIIAMEEDESHIQTLRSLNRRLSEMRNELPFFQLFPPTL